MMRMAMVLRTTFTTPTNNWISSTSQTITSQLRIFTTPDTETSQDTSIDTSIKDNLSQRAETSSPSQLTTLLLRLSTLASLMDSAGDSEIPDGQAQFLTTISILASTRCLIEKYIPQVEVRRRKK